MATEEKNTPTNTDPNPQPIVSEDELKIPSTAEPESDKHTNIVALLGVLLVILVLILVGLYLWSTTMQTNMPATTEDMEMDTMMEGEVMEDPEGSQMMDDTMVDPETAETLEELDTVLEDTTLDDLDAEFNAIDAEIDAALE